MGITWGRDCADSQSTIRAPVTTPLRIAFSGRAAAAVSCRSGLSIGGRGITTDTGTTGNADRRPSGSAIPAA